MSSSQAANNAIIPLHTAPFMTSYEEGSVSKNTYSESGAPARNTSAEMHPLTDPEATGVGHGDEWNTSV